MSGRIRVASPRIAGRHARALALLFSAAFHAFVLGWFALKRAAEPPQAESLAVNVELVRRPPPPPPSATAATPKPSVGRPTAAPPDAAVARAVIPAPAGSPAGVEPRWAVDLNGPVFADGRWPRPEPGLRTRCDPIADAKRVSVACRREDAVARGVTLANDPRNGKDEFAREARHNEAVRRYKELRGAPYPGIACHILHKC